MWHIWNKNIINSLLKHCTKLYTIVLMSIQLTIMLCSLAWMSKHSPFLWLVLSAPPCVTDTLVPTAISASALSLSWTPEHNPPNQCDADEYQVSYQPYDLRSCSTTTEEPGTLPWQSTATATVTNLSSNTYYRITLSSRNLPADGQAAVLGNSVNAVERKCREIIFKK